MENKEGKTWFQRRYLVTILLFLYALVTNTQRINITFAIVAMANSSDSKTSLDNHSTTNSLGPARNNESTSRIHKEFSWNPELQGYILSSSYIGFVLTLLPGGFLVSRYSIKSIVAGCIFVGSFCNLISPVAARTSPYLFAVVHLVKGMSQGPPISAVPLIVARWFPTCERGFLATIIYCGFPFGGFLGSIISGPISELDFDGGWPLIFYSCGLIGILVCILIFMFMVDKPDDDPSISEKELLYIIQNTKRNTTQQPLSTPWRAIMTSMQTHALFISLFAYYWSTIYLLTAHPLYMDTILNIPVRKNGLLTSGPQLAHLTSGFITSWLSSRLNHNDPSKVNFSRKVCNTLGSLIYVSGMVGLYLSGYNQTWNEIFLFVVTFSLGFPIAGCLIVASDMTPSFCGRLMGIASTIASLSGVFLSVLLGNLTKKSQTMVQWHEMFLITMIVTLLGGFAFLTMGSANLQPYDPAYHKEENLEDTNKPKKEVISSTRL